MKYHVIKYFYTLLLVNTIFGQTAIDKQYEYANHLFNNGNYFDAITEFKRVLFFDDEKKYGYSINFYIGASYKKGNFFENAIKYFTIAEQKTKDTNEIFSASIEIVRCNILRGTNNQALLLLNNLEADKRFSGRGNEISYWRGWFFIFEDDWENASIEFGKISFEHPLRKICMEVVEEEYSTTFAKTISYFIPGAGQIYSGEILSGLMSLSWNGILGYFAIKSFNSDRILDGFIYTGLFFRFHRGNVENANKFAQQRNSELSGRAIQKIYKKYSGEKP